MRLREVEHHLDRAWDLFPPELTDLSSTQPLEIAALRPLLDAQHARLLLYRSFTDFSKPLQATWRTFCLAQSVHTCKTSARLLVRCTYLQNWDTEFALKSNETVRIHAFRAAALLLLGHSINDPAVERVEKDEVLVCISALKASSERHHSMMKPMQMIEGLARMFGCDIGGVQGPLERALVEGEESTNGSGSDDDATSPEPMEWANFSIGGGVNEKTAHTHGSPKPEFPRVQVPGEQHQDDQHRRSQQYQQYQHQRQHQQHQSQQHQHQPQNQHQQQIQPSSQPEVPPIRRFDVLRGNAPSSSHQQQQSVQFPGGQQPLFSPEPLPYSRSQVKSGFRTAPGVLTPLVPETPSGLSAGIPTTPSVVSSLGGLMLSPIQRAQSSAPALPVPSPQLPPAAQPPSSSTPTLYLQHQSQPQSQPQSHSIHPQHPLLTPSHHIPPSDLSTAGVIDWDVFQNMMLLDNHGFGELLAAGPEAAWGYAGNGALAGIPGLSSLSDRSGYGGPPTTADEDRRRRRGESEVQGTTVGPHNVKAEDWSSG